MLPVTRTLCLKLQETNFRLAEPLEPSDSEHIDITGASRHRFSKAQDAVHLGIGTIASGARSALNTKMAAPVKGSGKMGGGTLNVACVVSPAFRPWQLSAAAAFSRSLALTTPFIRAVLDAALRSSQPAASAARSASRRTWGTRCSETETQSQSRDTASCKGGL